jgi:hypothetical protein
MIAMDDARNGGTGAQRAVAACRPVRHPPPSFRLGSGDMSATRFRFFLFALLLVLSFAAPAAAFTPAPSDEEKIRSTIARWYEELAKRDEGRTWDIVAPGYIDASPHYRHLDTGSRALGPRLYTSLAATARKFAWEVDSIRADSSFAKVRVWERGYFYAHAARSTYELGAATTFILERRESDGRWLILAHESSSQGIPPNKITRPMPNLRPIECGPIPPPGSHSSAESTCGF